jgi:hypothetical protein
MLTKTYIAFSLIGVAIISAGCAQNSNIPPSQTAVAAQPAPIAAQTHTAPTPQQAKALQGSYMMRQSEYWLSRGEGPKPVAKNHAKHAAVHVHS